MTIENKTDLEITISVLNYELSSDKEKSNRLDKGIDSVINESINLFNNECEINKYVGKNKKAFRIATTEKNGLTKLYQVIHKLGKNCLKVVKLIGENPITTKNNYTEKMENGGRITTIEGLKQCAKPTEKTEKTIEEKIENFIKSNTTKKEDDGKMTIKDLAILIAKTVEKMHKENNSNIVDFLPTSEELENQVVNAK